MTELSGGTESDVVFTFSTETWNDAKARGMARPPDRLLATLLSSDRVRTLVVANPYRSAPIQLLRRFGRRPSYPFPPAGNSRLVSPMRIRRSDPTAIRALTKTYRRYDRRLRGMSEQIGQQQPAVITTHPLVAGFAPFEWASSVTFYARDDWSRFEPMRPWWPAIELSFERIRRDERRVCAVSQPVLDRIAPVGPSSVVPNGIDPDEWRTPESAPRWFDELARPRLLYTGTIDDRLDVQVLVRVLDHFRDASLTLLGPVADRARLGSLLDHSRVRVRTAGSRSELIAITAAADVGLVPHRRTELTQAMSPLKLYEYLAAGLPVAAVDLPPIRSAAGPTVTLVGRDGDFVAAVSAALARGRASESERSAYISANAWSKRHAQILDVALPH